MKHARVMHQGRTHNATERDGQLLLDNGALVPQDSVTWLPPLPPTARPRTILALGLNYADHIEESGMAAPDKQVWFAKAPSAANGPFDAMEAPEGGFAVVIELPYERREPNPAAIGGDKHPVAAG